MLIRHCRETCTRIETNDDRRGAILERTDVQCLYVESPDVAACTHDCEEVCLDCYNCPICCRCCPGEG